MYSFIKLFILILISVHTSYAQTVSTSTSQVELCKAVNSLNLYTTTNLSLIQGFLKKSYFPKIAVTGYNDNQFKYYVGKYQYAFGIKTTGKLDNTTLKFIRSQNGCFDLENILQKYETTGFKRKIAKEELLIEVLKNNFYNIGASAVGGLVNVSSIPFVNFTTSAVKVFIPFVASSTDTIINQQNSIQNSTQEKTSATITNTNNSANVVPVEVTTEETSEEIFVDDTTNQNASENTEIILEGGIDPNDEAYMYSQEAF